MPASHYNDNDGDGDDGNDDDNDAGGDDDDGNDDDGNDDDDDAGGDDSKLAIKAPPAPQAHTQTFILLNWSSLHFTQISLTSIYI